MVFQAMRYFWNPTFSAVENGTSGENPMVSNKSALKDFLLSIASMSGDLSNITAPPFVLDQKSVVEIPAFWAENPAMFVSPANSEDPAERALLVLKGFLGGIKSQCYMGHTEEEGVKKPLNAFLGELFLGQWDDEQTGTTYLASEQVSHHPPITACRVWNAKHGVVAEGFNRQQVTFSWSSMSVHIQSTGFALKSLEKYNEYYLLPLPDFRVKGVLSGVPYPECGGEWYIPSTNGYMSKIDFSSGHGLLGGGKKHEFSAVLYREKDGPKHPMYTIAGCWNTEFTIQDERSGKTIETFSVARETSKLPKLKLPPLEEMDPWETRRAWHDTQEAIGKNDFNRVKAAKSHLEQGQRNMRKEEEMNGRTWQPLLFKNTSSHEVVAILMAKIPGGNFSKVMEGTKGAWVFDTEAYEKAERPFHPGLEPDNLKEGEERVYRNGSRASFQSESRNVTPRGSIDAGRASMDNGIAAFAASSPRSRKSIDHEASDRDSRRSIEHNVGVGRDGRPAEVNGAQTNGGRHPEHGTSGLTKEQPVPQYAQQRRKEEQLGSGMEGLSVKEQFAVEDMLREMYSSTGKRRSKGSKG
ncbi:hypothetical protein LTR70_005941 [Exophiala xenobiotica]|uniref:Oxysterol-binding protein n=1 Tax=Lithohypha guttulata TaxID=1690604 RepID=A0ABR0K738_9EURO|nr:hypothetical protein LTR24_006197 [Lithohypha guttulata]KAK5317201.1 hypothetical protein LTR70_005941 [Exophiala xenobiotica]